VCCIGTAQPLCTGNAYGIGAPSPTPTAQYEPAKTNIPTCSDSDGNGAWQTKGSVTMTYPNGTVDIKTDFCDGYITVDYYCSATYTGSPSVLIDMQLGRGGYVPSGCTCKDGACLSASGSVPAAQTNKTTQPGQTYIPIPTAQDTTPIVATPSTNYTDQTKQQTAQQKPIPTCTTDQDCSWTITNGCPETAGANWACNSLLEPIKTTSAVCPRALSPRPEANCGCIQNKCLAYLDKKPIEQPKRIGNTTVDATTLLGIVIKIEQLKIKFDFLQSAAEKLSKYYNLKGKEEDSEKWHKASQMLEDSINRLDKLKEYIRSKISDLTIEDLRSIKKEIKSVVQTIRDIVKAVI